MSHRASLAVTGLLLVFFVLLPPGCGSPAPSPEASQESVPVGTPKPRFVALGSTGVSVSLPTGFSLYSEGMTFPHTLTFDITRGPVSSTDAYSLWIYGRDAVLPFDYHSGEDMQSLLSQLKQQQQTDQFTVVQLAEHRTINGADALQLRVKELSDITQVIWIFARDGTVISVGGGGDSTKVPAAEQEQHFEDIVRGLSF